MRDLGPRLGCLPSPVVPSLIPAPVTPPSAPSPPTTAEVQAPNPVCRSVTRQDRPAVHTCRLEGAAADPVNKFSSPQSFSTTSRATPPASQDPNDSPRSTLVAAINRVPLRDRRYRWSTRRHAVRATEPLVIAPRKSRLRRSAETADPVVVDPRSSPSGRLPSHLGHRRHCRTGGAGSRKYPEQRIDERRPERRHRHCV